MAIVRDYVQHPVTLEYFQERVAEGWRLRAVEWEKGETVRTSEGIASESAESAPPARLEGPPYGLEVASDGVHLRSKSDEVQTLIRILEMIVAEKKISLIADELNLQGYRTRQGTKWTSSAVFDLLPRIVDMGPQLLKSEDWRVRREHIQLPPQ
jgi:hypothetical protein